MCHDSCSTCCFSTCPSQTSSPPRCWSWAPKTTLSSRNGKSARPQPHTAQKRKSLALLTDPWVFCSARQGGSVAAEGEHGKSDQCLRGAESERNSGQESDLGVGGFDQPLGSDVVKG